MKISGKYSQRKALCSKVLRLVASLGLVVVLLCLPSGCHNGDEDQLESCVDSFATAYFNWQFVKAAPYCTSGSRCWLSYAASQVTQEDVDSLRTKEEGAKVELGDIHYDNDSTAMVKVEVSNFLPMDTIGKCGPAVKKAVYRLRSCFRSGRWLVILDELPRPES